MNLPQWCRDVTGLPGSDGWTCYQFDSAVRSFGTWVENKLNDPEDKRGAQRILNSCLNDEAPASTFNRMISFFGMQRMQSAPPPATNPEQGSTTGGKERPSEELIRKVRSRR